MAKVFAGFTPEQLGKIDPSLQGLQSDEQQKIIAANPALAARVGKMSEMAQQRVGMAQGGYAKKGYAEGGGGGGRILPGVGGSGTIGTGSNTENSTGGNGINGAGGAGGAAIGGTTATVTNNGTIWGSVA